MVITSGCATVMVTVEKETLEQTIAHYLEYVLHIPISAQSFPDVAKVAVQAIEAANAHELDKVISLPACMNREGGDGTIHQEAFAYDLIRLLKLEQWLNPEWF